MTLALRGIDVAIQMDRLAGRFINVYKTGSEHLRDGLVGTADHPHFAIRPFLGWYEFVNNIPRIILLLYAEGCPWSA